MVSRESLKRARKLTSWSVSDDRVYQPLASDNTLNKFVKHRDFKPAGQKERGARQPHKRLLYYFNVNRTSLDHLLLGKHADVDKNVESPEYTAGSQRCQNNRPLNLWAGHIPRIHLTNLLGV